MSRLKIEYKDISELIPYINNPRINEGAVDKVAASIKDKDMFSIYAIYNNVNGKRYVGQTKQGYLKRYNQHFRKKSGCPALRNAISKYGENAFHPELLDIAYDRETANEKEKMWIKLLKTYEPENGYNLSMGGAIGDFNKATLEKMSKSKIGSNNSFYGRKHTKKAKKKMSEWKKKNYVKGNHPRARKVKCIETGKKYSSVVEASEDTGANKAHIGAVARGEYGRKTAGGYKWEYI